jgi:phage terminase large subunit-like protein
MKEKTKPLDCYIGLDLSATKDLTVFKFKLFVDFDSYTYKIIATKK